MTYLLRISFSLLLLAAAALSADVSGTVELANSRDSSVRKKHDFSGVAVWLEPAGGAVAVKPGVFTISQRAKRFTPHISIVPTGSTIDFPNFDPIFHNAFSNFAGQPFDTGLYPPGTSRKVRFQRPGVVRVFCNIHSTMSAVILVVNSSHSALTEPSGEFRIKGVPPGEYTLKVWHERATEAALEKLSRHISVDAQGQHIVSLKISEAGYLPVPHLNKHGAEYPPEPAGPGVYRGVAK
ncbi:MAG: carboxypeptidase regulatory-like domain-containing protein [Acidobacteriota bacterium]